jgi:hypothetical protein
VNRNPGTREFSFNQMSTLERVYAKNTSSAAGKSWSRYWWLVTALLGLGGVGCAPFQQQSDWRWQQMNPEYRLPYPRDY